MLLLDVILGIAVLVLLIYRQLSTRPVNASALRLIAILIIIGLLQTVPFLNRNHAHPLTFAAVGGSLVLAAIFGALRARTIRVWLQDGQAWSQGNWLTAALWIASLAAHLGYDILVVHGPGARGLGTATIVLYLADQPGLSAGPRPATGAPPAACRPHRAGQRRAAPARRTKYTGAWLLVNGIIVMVARNAKFHHARLSRWPTTWRKTRRWLARTGR